MKLWGKGPIHKIKSDGDQKIKKASLLKGTLISIQNSGELRKQVNAFVVDALGCNSKQN